MTMIKEVHETKASKAKVFPCTGFENCRMVFTRSEHLARHTRKHTGEKPFQCIISGCERMFSRYDNMMQHTQTHNKTYRPKRSRKETKKDNYRQHLTIQELNNPISDKDKCPRIWSCSIK